VSRDRARRCLLALAVTLGLLVLTPSPSWACSCAMADTPQHVREAVTVASGTVDWTATDGQTRTYKVDFDGVYKGATARSEKLTTNAMGASCGVANLATGKRYLFFIEGKHPGTMRIGLCGGTVAYDDAVAGEIGAVTGPPGKPLGPPEASRPGGRADAGAGTGRAVTLGLVAAVVAGLAAAVVVRRRRSAPA
jgi:hypothetical protein